MQKLQTGALCALAISVVATQGFRAYSAQYSFAIVDERSGTAFNFGQPALSGNHIAYGGSNVGTVIRDGMGGSAIYSGITPIDGLDLSGDRIAMHIGLGGDARIVSGNGGPFETHAQVADATPIGPISHFEGANFPTVSGDSTLFFAFVLGSMGTTQALFVDNGAGPVPVLKEGDPSPFGEFVAFNRAPAIDDSRIAFRGTYDPATSVSTRQGIFAFDGTAVTTIANAGDPAPTGVFDRTLAFGHPVISGDMVAFAANYGSNSSGIFVGNGGPLTTLAKTGDSAPTGTFEQFGDPSIAEGVVGFSARFGSNNYGVFISKGGPLQTILKTGDALFGSTIVQVSLGRFGLDDADTGDFAFNYALADGRKGIGLATVVPEPASVALIAFGLGGGVMRSRRRR